MNMLAYSHPRLSSSLQTDRVVSESIRRSYRRIQGKRKKEKEEEQLTIPHYGGE